MATNASEEALLGINSAFRGFMKDRDFKGAEAYLLGLLEEPLDDEVRGSVFSKLRMVLVTLNRNDEALSWAKRRTEEAPNDPLAWQGLGQQYRHRSGNAPTERDLTDALQAYRKGVDVARSRNFYVRFLIGDVCRTLARLEDFPALEIAMKEYLAALEVESESDIPKVETDWLSYTPDGAIDEILRQTFHDLENAMKEWRKSIKDEGEAQKLPTMTDLRPFLV